MFDLSEYYEAASLKEAIELNLKFKDSKYIAGGTDVLIKSRGREEGYISIPLIGITRIKELNEIKLYENGDLFIGAACSFTKVEKNPIVNSCVKTLVLAVGVVGGPQTRNQGTIGGNVCNGATSADSATTLFAHDAILIIEGQDARREVPIKEFYIGPSKVTLNKGDILVGIKILKQNYENYKGHYIKFAQRNAMDIANLGCSIVLKTNNNIIEDLRIAFGVAGPTPIRAYQAEEFAKGKEINEENLNLIGEKCLESSRARDSWRASKEFREQLIKELPIRGIKTAIGGAK